MRVGVASIVVACLLLVAATVEAGPIIFKWVDKKGDLHATDRLGDVPEPYYSMYAAKLQELEKSGGPPKATGRAPASRAGSGPEAPTARASAPEPIRSEAGTGSSAVGAAIRKREEWRELVAHWRRELELATAAYEEAQAGVDTAQRNPILVHTPQGKAKVDAAMERLAKALGRVKKAREMLLVGLPARAKREQVPPKWLE